MAQIIVAPSLLAAHPGKLEEEILAIEKAGATWLHLDVMDGHFVPPITFGDNIISAARKASSKLFLDTHLMVENPESFIDSFYSAGSNSITIHQEATPNAHRALQKIRSLGMKAGIAINPGTPAESVFPLLEIADIVLVMTVNPGWGGQAFIPEMTAKITRLSDEILKRNLDTKIEVDGGINDITGQMCVEAGAFILVAGSYIFKSPSYKDAINSLLIEN